jgi:multicomponent Na+:H+ antiporter subunit B
MAVYTMRIIAPIMLLFGVYIIANGHVSPGGGFQGGLVIASFYICRYMIYSIHDLSITKLSRLEDLAFTGLILIAILVIFLGDVVNFMTDNGVLYLTAMNALIGIKVACGFTIIFYRYVAVERD